MFEAGSFCSNLLILIGAYAGVQYLYDNFKSPVEIIWSLLFPKSAPFSERYGKWAVITGSSDGIGKEYAKNLARKGMNIMLIARTESKLVQVAQEIRSQYDVEVKWITADFSVGPRIYDRIREQLSDIEVGVLVNNVGMLHEHPATVDELATRDIQQTFSVNMYPTAMMVHMLLPEMKRRHKGIVVNVTSSSGLLPVPYITLYAASKAFLNSFSQGLQAELRGTGVECQLVTTLCVDTNLSQQWHSTGFWYLISVGVERYARMAVWTIGRVEVTSGYWWHAMQIAILRILPRWVTSIIMGEILKYTKTNIFEKKN